METGGNTGVGAPDRCCISLPLHIQWLDFRNRFRKFFLFFNISVKEVLLCEHKPNGSSYFSVLNWIANTLRVSIIKSVSLQWAGHVVKTGESRNAYSGFEKKALGKWPPGRRRMRWYDYTRAKIYLRWICYEEVRWMEINQDLVQWCFCITVVERLCYANRWLRNELCYD
jgi:hypothetical protein